MLKKYKKKKKSTEQKKGGKNGKRGFSCNPIKYSFLKAP